MVQLALAAPFYLWGCVHRVQPALAAPVYIWGCVHRVQLALAAPVYLWDCVHRVCLPQRLWPVYLGLIFLPGGLHGS
jgi:hypothetical protein